MQIQFCGGAQMEDFSAHADRDDLLSYVGLTPPEKLRHIFLVHGEAEQALPLRETLQNRGYRSVAYPSQNEKLTI